MNYKPRWVLDEQLTSIFQFFLYLELTDRSGRFTMRSVLSNTLLKRFPCSSVGRTADC